MKSYKLLLLLLIGISIVGCADLTEEPQGLLAPEGFFQTPNDIPTAVDGAFTHAINESIGEENYLSL